MPTMDFAERWSDKRQQVEVANFQQRLNELGAEGWEMISYESVPMYGAFSNKLKGLGSDAGGVSMSRTRCRRRGWSPGAVRGGPAAGLCVSHVACLDFDGAEESPSPRMARTVP